MHGIQMHAVNAPISADLIAQNRRESSNDRQKVCRTICDNKNHWCSTFFVDVHQVSEIFEKKIKCLKTSYIVFFPHP